MIYALLTLALLGAALSIILYFIAQKFKVIEDPRIDLVDDVLPKANCGGCGYPGCRKFAEVTVEEAEKNQSLEGLNCPVGGNDVMKEVAAILGLEVEEKDPMIAVVRCNGSKKNSPAKIKYDGPATCAFAHNLYAGEGGCPNGCLGLGDCVAACDFDAIHMNPETGLPVVNDKCVACGACVKACPRGIIELRKKGPKNRRIFVSCINTEKGGPAKKNCEVACIGCSKCFKVCAFDAIKMENNLAYIDFEKCTLCRKCVPECPTNAIHELNFRPRKPKAEKPERPKTEATAAADAPTASAKKKNDSDNESRAQ